MPAPVPPLPTTRVPGVASFKPGKHNGEDFSPEFVKQLHDNYKRFAQPDPKTGHPWYVPYISVNHDKFPMLAGLRIGQLVNSVYPNGEGGISFDADGVPVELAQLISTKMLAHPSIEFVRPKYGPDGKPVSGFEGPDGQIVDGPVIKALTFLGADAPGVKGSAPLPQPVFNDPVTSFRFRGGIVSYFGETSMLPRDQVISALEALGFDTTQITQDVPDEFLNTLLSWLQSKNQTTGEEATEPGAAGPAPMPAMMNDALAGLSVPSVSGTGGNAPSQVVVKFNQNYPGMLTTLLNAVNTATQKANAANKIAARTVATDKARAIDSFFAKTDISGTGQVTPHMRKTLRPLLEKCDHVATVKFADGKTTGTDLERTMSDLLVSLPVVSRSGHRTPQDAAGVTPSGGAPTLVTNDRIASIIGKNSVGMAALKKARANNN